MYFSQNIPGEDGELINLIHLGMSLAYKHHVNNIEQQIAKKNLHVITIYSEDTSQFSSRSSVVEAITRVEDTKIQPLAYYYYGTRGDLSLVLCCTYMHLWL